MEAGHRIESVLGNYPQQPNQTAFAIGSVQLPLVAGMARVVVIFLDSSNAEERQVFRRVSLHQRLRSIQSQFGAARNRGGDFRSRDHAREPDRELFFQKQSP